MKKKYIRILTVTGEIYEYDNDRFKVDITDGWVKLYGGYDCPDMVLAVNRSTVLIIDFPTKEVESPKEAPEKGEEEMTLKQFVERWLKPNTIVRLFIQHEKGRKVIVNSNPSITKPKEVGWAWEILDGTGWQAAYADKRVQYITGAYCHREYMESVNIVIEV